MYLLLLLLLMFIVLIIIANIYYKRIYLFNFYLKKYPTPPSYYLLGHAPYFFHPKGSLAVFLDFVPKYGESIKANVGPTTFILTIEYKLIEFILSNTKTLKKSPPYRFLNRWLGKGLLTNDGGPKWRKHRKILTPAFHFKVLEDYLEIFESIGRKFIKRLENDINKDSFDIQSVFSLYTLDVICETTMGTSVNALENENSEYVQSVKQMLKILIDRSFSLPKNFDILYYLSNDYRKETKLLKILHNFADNVINTKLEKLNHQHSDNNETIIDDNDGIKYKKSFLDILIEEMKRNSLSLDDIRQEVETFIFAGHDTTSSALSFLIYNLANHPEVQEKVYLEQCEIFKDNFDRSTKFQDLREMKYLELVIKETLRLYPPVPFYARQLDKDVKYDGGILPKELCIIIFAYGIHRNPKYFFEPEKFNPDRFNQIDSKYPCSYIPFSIGPRNCIGQKFALTEIKTIASKLIKSFEFLPADPPQLLDIRSEIVLISRNGVNIKIRKRYYR